MVYLKSLPKDKKILYFFMAVSLVAHISVTISKFGFPALSNFSTPPEEKRIVIKLKSSKNRQIVETQNANLKKPTDTKYLSAKNNAFDRQTRSRFIDKFATAHKGVRNAQEKKVEKVDKKSETKNIKNLKFSDLAVKPAETYKVKKNKKLAKSNSQRLGLKSGKTTGKALGASSDFLEKIPLGDFTKLNTQEYEYYGFYHRIRQKLEQFWGANIQNQAEKIFKQGRSIATESNLLTGLTIKIDGHGKIVDIILKSTSGIKELDDAAIKSFNQAGPFPNPPKGMLKADGKAIIEWGFVVNT